MIRFQNLPIVVPSDPYEAKGLISHALRAKSPVLFYEHRCFKTSLGHVPDQSYEIAFGQARVVIEGTDLTIVTIGSTVSLVSAIAQELSRSADPISAEVIDLRTVVPIDTDTVFQSLQKTGRLLVIDEEPFGIAAEVATILADQGFDELDAPIRRLSNRINPNQPQSPLLTEIEIEDSIRELMDQ